MMSAAELQAQALDAQLIDVDLLPAALQELCSVIGLDATLALAGHWPGVPLYIPATASAEHAIAEVIGLEPFRQLVKVYRTDTLHLPKIDAAVRQVKHRVVRQLRNAGRSNREVALMCGYTQRYIEMLNRQDRDDAQPDLFED